jgi:hypothetical protein
MYHEGVTNRLSNAQRRFLIKMIDGPHLFVNDVETGLFNTRLSLFRAHLIRMCGPDMGTIICSGAKHFCLTDDGRQVVCFVLAEYAEALVQAELDGFPSVNEILARLSYRSHERGKTHETKEPV